MAAKSFQELPRLIQIILLLIPGVNWVTEIIVRISAVIERPDAINVLGLIIAIFVGFAFGWVDLIWCLLFKHLILCLV
ncbi:MAG: hypothetical protein IKP77_00575 [Acholeplasmatales bacterium]|nr:hypothetical protein [Acholeplasmatales bacterium]